MTDDDLELAGEVSVGTVQFAQTFLRAQANGSGPGKNFDEVAKPDLAPRVAIATGFAHARAEDWLDDLCTQCLADRVVRRGFVALAARQTAAPGIVDAQALIDPLSPFRDTLLEAKGLIHVADYVCRIVIDDKHSGTGFLVRSDIVLTAGHVITPPDGGEPLVGAGGAAEPGAKDRIKVFFDDKIDIIAGHRRRVEPRRFGVSDNWLIAHSAPETGNNGLHAAQAADYALIRLDSAPLVNPEDLALDDQDPFSTDPVLIVQHPVGRAMCHGDGKVDAPDPATRFFTHDVNTEDGSSGAPCFGIDFRVIGVHNGAVLNADPPRNTALSVAVPAAILANLPQTPARARYLTELRLANGQNRLVVGREDTQDLIRDSLGDSMLRILAVPPAERKSGMTFTADLLEAMLPRDQHRVVRLSAEQFRNEDPVSFARRLFTAAGAPATMQLDDTPDPNTTLESWLHRVFVPLLLVRLDELRGGRMVWIVLDDLRLPLATDNGLRECLNLIYEAVADHDWLRIMLLGYGTTPPSGAAPYLGRIDLGEISADLIRTAFLERVAVLADPDTIARISTNFEPLWNHLEDLNPLRQLDFAAAAVAPFVEDLA